MTLAEAVETIKTYCRAEKCDKCVFGKGEYCDLGEVPIDWKTPIETNLYDEEEIHKNCTVQILKNSITGETSIGWWENDSSNDMGAGRT